MTTIRTLTGATLCSLCAVLMFLGVGSAHDPGFVLGGVGTATVDGVLSPGEWDRAGAKTFDVDLPAHDGGGTTTVTLYVMNDSTNLYVAMRLARPALGGATNVSVHFDRDHDGIRVTGDDGFGMGAGDFSPAVLVDAFRRVTPTTIEEPRDDSDGGTNDGAAAATADGTFTYVEMSHPLDSTDDAHDFSLSAGDLIGFGGFVNLFSLDTSCSPGGPPCSALTDFAGGFADPVGDLVILSADPGSCHVSAAESRRRFVEACVAAGASRASCNQAGTEIMLDLIARCSAR